MRPWRLPGSPLSHAIPRSVPEMLNRSRVLLGPFGPVTQSTSDVGAPAIEGGGGAAPGCGAGAGFGRGLFAFGGIPGAGGLGPGGNTSACGRIGADRGAGAVGLSSDEISGASPGSGAWAFV